MGTLVLTPQAIYAAYLAGYLAAPPGDIIDTDDLTREAPSPAAVTLLAAYSLGKYDTDVQPPRALRQLVSDVRNQLAEEQPDPAAALDLDLAAMVDAVRLGSWTTAENIALVVRSKHAITADRLADLMTLCEARAREHNASLERPITSG